MDNKNIIIIVLVVAMAAMGGLWLMDDSTGTGTLVPATPSTPSTPASAAVTGQQKIFDSNGFGQFRPALQNMLNVSSTEYLSADMRIYSIDDSGAETYMGTVTTQTTGVQARDATSGTINLQGLDNYGKPMNYVAYVAASDGSITSGRYTFDLGLDTPKVFPTAKQATIIQKFRDQQNYGWLMESSEVTAAGATNTSGKSWHSTTSNTTGQAVGQGGYIHYTWYVSTNGTAATDTQFEDKRTLIAIDLQDSSDWDAPSISAPGAIVTKLASGNYNSKIANGGYDLVYEITNADGTPYHIGSTFSLIDILTYAKSGVDPSDNIGVALITEGYFKETSGDRMKIDSNRDDSNQTPVYTVQTATLVIS